MHCAYCGSWVEHVSYAPCASCNQPTNGAPARIARSGMSPAATAILIGVIALFVLVFFGGIVAAIAIPNMLTAQQRAKQRRTMADMRVIATAVESYAVDHNVYPGAESMDELQQKVPVKLGKFDAWGNELRYRCVNDCTGYAITSSGSDRVFEHVMASEYTQGRTTSFEEDIVFMNGSFLRSPEGF